MIEPSQKIKKFISNLCVKIDFQSNFSTNEDLLDYRELREASLILRNISFTFVTKVGTKEGSHEPRVIVDELLVNGLGSNIEFAVPNSGLFIREVQTFLDVSKDYFMSNVISLLEDFKEPIQKSLDKLINDLS